MKHLLHLTISLPIALCIGFVALAALPLNAQAQTEATASPSAELREIIRQRIEETIQENRNTGPKFIGTLGTISKVSTGTFSIVDTTGRERTVELTPETTLLVDNETAELSDVSIDAGVVVMGTELDEVIINARRVLVQDDNFMETREVFLGNVTEIGFNSLTLTTRGSNESIEVDLLTTTVYEDSLGDTISVSDVQEDQSVLVITDLDSNDNRDAVRLRLLVPVDSLETDQ